MTRPRGRPREQPCESQHQPGKKRTKDVIALSDSEGSDVDMPVRGGPHYPKDDDLIADADGADDAGEGSESGSDEEDEDVFVVEEIKQHLVDQDVRRLYPKSST